MHHHMRLMHYCPRHGGYQPPLMYCAHHGPVPMPVYCQQHQPARVCQMRHQLRYSQQVISRSVTQTSYNLQKV